MTVQEQRLQKEKVRVFELARELDLESKDLMVLCRQNGIELKNQLSTVGPELRDQIVELVKRGPGTAAAQATRTPAAPVLPTVINRKVQTLETRRAAPARPPGGPPPSPPPGRGPRPAHPPPPAPPRGAEEAGRESRQADGRLYQGTARQDRQTAAAPRGRAASRQRRRGPGGRGRGR